MPSADASARNAPRDDTELITAHVRRIEVKKTEAAISLVSEDHASDGNKTPFVVTVPWTSTSPRHHRSRGLIAGRSPSDPSRFPDQARQRDRTRPQWLAKIEDGTATIDDILKRETSA
jgi:hypothetical protein